ncbi:response regulator [Pseudenhygromyxa sp. WMMC2535]|uniref:response regulator n=1 Tax=Pseudenhygromyxa sp. WMMC2535 TaxID=2712867 RepID=UPI001557B312|nr:response regulator [Pseudenhygromyxa sp. WMMC2535]NVB42378.1 response regulator [Pseudenhygromyxa sp. WMMC2535]
MSSTQAPRLEHHQPLFDALSTPAAVLCPRGEVLATNAAWRQQSSRPDYPQTGQSYLETWREIDDPRARALLEGIESVATGSSTQLALDVSHPAHEETRWLELRVAPFASNDARWLLVTQRDITAERLAADRRAHAERAYEVALRNIPRGVALIVDHQLNVSPVGGASSSAGQRDLQAILTAHFGALEPLFRAALAGQRKEEQHLLGDTRYELRALPVHDDAGQVIAGVVLCHDTSDRQHLEGELRQARGAAHDFNNLLMAISGTASLALRRIPPDSPLQRHLDNILNATMEGAQITEQLRKLSAKPQAKAPALPRSAPTPDEPREGPVSASSPAMLLVEDDGLTRAALADLLRRAGHRVLAAADASEAQRLAADEGPVAALISDLRLPDLDGFELGRRLSASRPKLPILYLSGQPASAAELAAQLDRPQTTFMQKPIEFERVLRVLEQLLCTAQ